MGFQKHQARVSQGQLAAVSGTLLDSRSRVPIQIMQATAIHNREATTATGALRTAERHSARVHMGEHRDLRTAHQHTLRQAPTILSQHLVTLPAMGMEMGTTIRQERRITVVLVPVRPMQDLRM